MGVVGLLQKVDEDLVLIDNAIGDLSASTKECKNLSSKGMRTLGYLISAKARLINARCMLISVEVRY